MMCPLRTMPSWTCLDQAGMISRKNYKIRTARNQQRQPGHVCHISQNLKLKTREKEAHSPEEAQCEGILGSAAAPRTLTTGSKEVISVNGSQMHETRFTPQN